MYTLQWKLLSDWVQILQYKAMYWQVTCLQVRFHEIPHWLTPTQKRNNFHYCAACNTVNFRTLIFRKFIQGATIPTPNSSLTGVCKSDESFLSARFIHITAKDERKEKRRGMGGLLIVPSIPLPFYSSRHTPPPPPASAPLSALTQDSQHKTTMH